MGASVCAGGVHALNDWLQCVARVTLTAATNDRSGGGSGVGRAPEPANEHLRALRALGEAAHAERYARRSLNMDGRFVRGKAFNLSRLATALAEQDDIEQACAVGLQALGVAAGLRSARSVRYIKDLQSALHRRADAAAVQTFNARVAERLPAASARTGRP
jgi:hypothetical protein